jgi:hypothetical protein
VADGEDDFFDSAPAKPMYGLTDDQSYYRYPPPPGVEVPKGWRGWRRMTNLAGAFADQRALQIWLEWKAWMGLRTGDGILFDEWMARNVDGLPVDKQKALVTDFAERARAAAGGNVAARKGTARHDMLEGYLKTGNINGTRPMRVQMQSLLHALEAHELDPLPGWSERRVWHPAAGGTMGTLDMGVSCRRTGQIGIMDLKTQGRFFTFQEIAAQQFGYDDAPWVWEGPPDDTGRWVKNEAWNLLGVEGGEFAGRRVALLAHMPLDLSPVRIIEVPLDYGAEVLACAAENVRLRSIGKSVKAGRRVGAERPLSHREDTLTSRTMAR